MSRPITFITSHSLDDREPEANRDDQRRFAEFVAAHRPQLLDFQAYVSEDKSQLKLIFVFPDSGAGARAETRPEPNDQRDRASGLAGVLARAVIVALFFAAVYIGSVGASTPA
jgi:hypothetical protein